MVDLIPDPWIPVAPISEEAARTVRAMVTRRLDGAEREQVLDMLFGTPRSQQRRPTIMHVTKGRPVPPEAHQLVRELAATGLPDGVIADRLGISRQAVTGIRNNPPRKAS